MREEEKQFWSFLLFKGNQMGKKGTERNILSFLVNNAFKT